MSSHYGVVFPEFWTGPTGRAIAEHGGRNARLLALFLMTGEPATMLGLYHLPLSAMDASGVTGQRLVRALEVLTGPEVHFAAYDLTTEHVWVFEMAKFRTGIQQHALTPGDRRVLACRKLYAELADNAFLRPFFARYGDTLHLKTARDSASRTNKVAGDLDGVQRNPTNCGKPVETCGKVTLPPSAHPRSRARAIRDQGSGTGISKSTRAVRADAVLTALVYREVAAAVRRGNGEDLSFEGLTETVKVAAARAHLAYDGTSGNVLREALDHARGKAVRRGRAS